MTALIAPLYGFAVLLAAAGVLKLADTASTRGAMEAAGLPSSKGIVWSLGVAEIAIGAAVVITGSAVAAGALAVAYGAFTAFVAMALIRRLPVASCGCFGKDDTPPSFAHLVVTAAAVVVGGWTAIDPVGPLVDAVPDAGGLWVIAGAAVIAHLAYLTITALPRTMALVGADAGARLSRP